MKNQVITVQLMERWRTPRVTTYQIPRTAICLEGPIYYGKIEKEIINTWTQTSGQQYEHSGDGYKLSQYFESAFLEYRALQSMDKKYECYKILLGDEKIIIDEDEIVDRQ